MPAYLVQHRNGQRGDMLIEDPNLTLTFSGNWAIFADSNGTYLAIPADQAATIQRIDPDQDGQPEDKPAPGR
jgi:hypothetical protein